MADSTGKRRASIGVLFWIAFILLVLVIFLANRSNIEQVLETTGVVDVIRDRVGRDDAPADDEQNGPADGLSDESSEPVETDVVLVDENNPATDTTDNASDGRSPATGGRDGSDTTETPGNSETSSPQPANPRTTSPDVVTADPVSPAPDAAKPNRRMAALYYIKVTDDGRTLAFRVIRPVYYAESPLTETLRTLIAGPTGDELDEGLLNLIPPGTELISAHVSNEVAYLNFNQSFRFNPMGAEGTVAQLQQIIYSSTEFSTVRRVQFLIEGERFDYVGGDGIYIGEPLGRDAFSS